jgi:hippurate hydrolase
MTTKINGSLKSVIAPERIITNFPAIMGSEDFPNLVLHNSKTVYDYMWVGIANNEAFSKAIK